MGNPHAPVKLVEYASMTCPHCADFSVDASEAIRNDYVKSGQVSFELRNFVLNGIDMAAALLSRCQGGGPFFQLTAEVFAAQDQWMQGFQSMSEATAQQLHTVPPEQQIAALAEAGDLYSFFQMRGLPQAKARACVSDQQAVDQLVAMGQRATDHSIRGTPAFILNGRMLDVADWASLEPLIRAKLGLPSKPKQKQPSAKDERRRGRIEKAIEHCHSRLSHVTPREYGIEMWGRLFGDCMSENGVSEADTAWHLENYGQYK